MSTTPTPILAEVQALAVRCAEAGDPDITKGFEQRFGVTPDAFTALDEQAQRERVATMAQVQDSDNTKTKESHGNALKGELMVYAVAVESESSGKVDWYWDRGDSEAAFEAAKKEFADCPGEKITHFKLELPHAMCADEITNLVDDAMHEGEYETLAIHEMKSLDNALAAADDSATLMVSLDGGQTFIPAPSGVRLIYKNVLVPAEEELGELHINATSEGLISDLWVSRDEELDHNLGTKSQLIDDLVEQLVDDPVIDDCPTFGM